MSGNETLQGIPITVQAVKPGYRLHWQRRAFQLATIAVALLIPVSGLFRIDPIAGAFVILDHQIWWADFFLVFGLWVLVASGLVLLYSTVGTAFCGWSCPQNTLSEWANHMTRSLLGKRAQVQLDGSKMQVVSNKNKWVNWLLLGAALALASLFFALIPLFYFYSPQVVWSFVTFREDARLAASLHFIYFIFVIVVFIDIAFIRHFWCRFMCVYKVWQHGFKTKQTLRVTYDASRAQLCEKCNYCLTQCFIDLDPRKTDIYDSCINCGECITACNNLQAKKGRAGLLRFDVGQRQTTGSMSLFSRLSTLSSRVRWTIPFSLVGLVMFVWGLVSYQSYHLAVYRADTLQGGQILDYRVAVSNKVYRNTRVTVEVQGLQQGEYELSSTEAVFDNVGRVDLLLHVKDILAPGLHPFIVKVAADSGWKDSYRVQHFVAHNK